MQISAELNQQLVRELCFSLGVNKSTLKKTIVKNVTLKDEKGKPRLDGQGSPVFEQVTEEVQVSVIEEITSLVDFDSEWDDTKGAYVLYGTPRSGKSTLASKVISDNDGDYYSVDEPESYAFGSGAFGAMLTDIITKYKKGELPKMIGIDSLRLQLFTKSGAAGREGISNEFRATITKFHAFARMIGINILLVFTGPVLYLEDLRASCAAITIVDNLKWISQRRADPVASNIYPFDEVDMGTYKVSYLSGYNIPIDEPDLISDLCNDMSYAKAFAMSGEPMNHYDSYKRGLMGLVQKGVSYTALGAPNQWSFKTGDTSKKPASSAIPVDVLNQQADDYFSNIDQEGKKGDDK